MKERKILAIICLFMICFICLSPPKDDTQKLTHDDLKIKRLIALNDTLNRAITWKRYSKIFDMYTKARNKGLRPAFLPTKKYFIQNLRENDLFALRHFHYLSYETRNDTAITINSMKGCVWIFPFVFRSLTVAHTWVYRDNDWYLILDSDLPEF